MRTNITPDIATVSTFLEETNIGFQTLKTFDNKVYIFISKKNYETVLENDEFIMLEEK